MSETLPLITIETGNEIEQQLLNSGLTKDFSIKTFHSAEDFLHADTNPIHYVYVIDQDLPGIKNSFLHW